MREGMENKNCLQNERIICRDELGLDMDHLGRILYHIFLRVWKHRALETLTRSICSHSFCADDEKSNLPS